MQNQVLYAPFVKAQDKVRKDVAELSLADFQPKRFALNYDPPMISKQPLIDILNGIKLLFPIFDFQSLKKPIHILTFLSFSIVLEYLVPSTGKLYHHKMKLRRLTGKSTVQECIKYLQKRHPLYFINDKMRMD